MGTLLTISSTVAVAITMLTHLTAYPLSQILLTCLSLSSPSSKGLPIFLVSSSSSLSWVSINRTYLKFAM